MEPSIAPVRTARPGYVASAHLNMTLNRSDKKRLSVLVKPPTSDCNHANCKNIEYNQYIDNVLEHWLLLDQMGSMGVTVRGQPPAQGMPHGWTEAA